MRQVYLNEYGIPADNNALFFPYTSGLIQAYAQQSDIITNNYEFQPTIFTRDTVDHILKKYDNPSVAGFSTYIWNYQLSLAVAQKLKEKFPGCLIIFGGPQIEKNGTRFFKDNPFVDLCVYGEGEKLFSKTLIDLQENNQSLTRHQVLSQTDLNTNLDIFPSPYTAGVFDNLIKLYPEIRFKGLVEISRNCPFQCAYCCWGHEEFGKRVKYHSHKYVKEDAEWFGKNKIEYLFCTDGNFGMFKRDIKSAQIYSNTKKKYGFPKIFRVCFGKNSVDTIFETASILNRASLAKSVSLSMQSQNSLVLKSINRHNIKHQTFEKLQQKYIDEGITTYTELILGLPNETKQSFLDGIEKTLQDIKHNQILIYQCQVLKNTKLNSQQYRDRYELSTTIRTLNEPHSIRRQLTDIPEYEEIITGTNTLTTQEWMECVVIAWTVQLFHSFKIANKLIPWLSKEYNIPQIDIYQSLIYSNLEEIKKFWYIVNTIFEGHSESQYDIRFGSLNYEPEEMAFLDICCDKDKFYKELRQSLIDWIGNKNLVYNTNIDTLITTQKSNLPNVQDFENLENFAIKTIIYGGKDNKTTDV